MTSLQPVLAGTHLTAFARDTLMTKVQHREEQSAEVAEQFEAMFASILLKSLRQTVGGDGLFPGDSSDTFGALFDQFMGEHIAEGGGVGIGKFLEAHAQLDKPPSPTSHAVSALIIGGQRDSETVNRS